MEKGTAVLAFPLMDFLVKRQGINKPICAWKRALCVWWEVTTRDSWGAAVD